MLGTNGSSVGNQWFLRWKPMVPPLETDGFSVGNQRFLNEKPLETDGASNGICRWDNRDLSLCTKK